MPAKATLTEDERLAVAAMGGWAFADALSGQDEALRDSHAGGMLDDLMLIVRPSWRGKMYDIERARSGSACAVPNLRPSR